MAKLVDIAAGTIAGLAPTPVESYVITNFFLHDELFNALDFVPNGTGGSTGNIATSYVQYSEQNDVDFRGMGEEYDSEAATPEPKTVYLKNLGGAYPVDINTTRALKNGGLDVYRQSQAQLKAAGIKKAFGKYFIKGDKSVNPKQFDGVYAAVIANKAAQENTTPVATGGKMDDTVAFEIELYCNELISRMNVTPNYVITTRTGAAFLKSVNARRNYATAAVEVNGVKYNQFMGINIIEVDDAAFPTAKLAIGLPVVFVYLADDEKGIKVGIPMDGTVIYVQDPELGDGTLVKSGALDMLSAPYFQNLMSVAIGYINTAATP